MRISNPGGLLTLLTVLAPVAVGWVLYLHWWTVAALLTPIALCHLGVLFQIRPAAYLLLAAYIIGCVFIVVSFFGGTSIYHTWWRLALKLCLNLMVIQELRLWLRRQVVSE